MFNAWFDREGVLESSWKKNSACSTFILVTRTVYGLLIGLTVTELQAICHLPPPPPSNRLICAKMTVFCHLRHCCLHDFYIMNPHDKKRDLALVSAVWFFLIQQKKNGLIPSMDSRARSWLWIMALRCLFGAKGPFVEIASTTWRLKMHTPVILNPTKKKWFDSGKKERIYKPIREAILSKKKKKLLPHCQRPPF